VIQRTGAAFRSGTNQPFGIVLTDQGQPAFGQYTDGAVAMDSVDITADPKWEALSFTITGQLMVVLVGQPTAGSVYGQFGKILCGLSTQGPETPNPDSAGWSFGLTTAYPLPRDQSLLATLWDPVTDLLPPLNENVAPYIYTTLPVDATVSLPQSFKLAGTDLYAAIWMQPSIFGSSSGVQEYAGYSPVALALLNAQFVLVYDDGRKL
jgi:hypothetical protein